MLILTRRIGETVRIGDDIYLTVLGLKGNQIRLGLSAPQNISIHREEVYLKIKEEKKIGLDVIKDSEANEEVMKSQIPKKISGIIH